MKEPGGSGHSQGNVDHSRASPSDRTSEQTLDLAAIYREHGDFVWKTLQRMGVAESDLPDLAQEVFIVVHKRLHTFDRSSRVTTWLYGICLRVASSFRRRAWFRRERLVDEVPERNSRPAVQGDDWMAVQQAQRRVREVLDTMDLDKRSVFVMFEIEELSCSEIAEVLGVPVGTTWSRLHAARMQFQASLARLEARAWRGGAT